MIIPMQKRDLGLDLKSQKYVVLKSYLEVK